VQSARKIEKTERDGDGEHVENSMAHSDRQQYVDLVTMNFDLMTTKLICESSVTKATFTSILGFLGACLGQLSKH